MELKDLLVHVDASPESEVRVEIAAELARRHGAHLIGLYVVDLVPILANVEMGSIAGRSGMLEAVGALRADAMAEPERVAERFRARLDAAGVTGEWRLEENVVAPTVALHARYADLAILGQVNPDHPPPGSAAELVPHVLLASGRPVLVIPYVARFGPLGRNVLVGWNGSREAARALNDAIPFIAGAQAVTVVSINPRHGIGGHGDVPAADIALHLARHGLRVEADHMMTEIAEGDALLDCAADRGCDLIVAGGYGHSRLREFALGGVTRTLLRSMTVPVLLSH
ncbi:MAG TPA: universal stress protein [Stellaceae bacterium]|nr:universal stress protein [Stellaceae bacterium]